MNVFIIIIVGHHWWFFYLIENLHSLKKIISAICVHHHHHHQWRQYEKKKLQRSFCQSVDDFQFFFVDWMVVYDRHEFVSNSKIQRPCYYHHHHYLFINKGGKLNLYFFMENIDEFFHFHFVFRFNDRDSMMMKYDQHGKKGKKTISSKLNFFRFKINFILNFEKNSTFITLVCVCR